MKKLLLLFSFWPLFAIGQIYFDFESGLTGDWEQYPQNRWESSGAEPLSGTRSLHHIYDNPVAGIDIISLKTGIFNPDSMIRWEFIIRHSYTPSSSNKWLIFLLSDSPANKMIDKGIFNGYGIGVNLTSSDDSLRFYVFQNGVPVSNISLGMNYESEAGINPYFFRIYRNNYGTWDFEGGQYGKGSRKLNHFTLTQKFNFKARYFGIRYTYSSSRDRLFWLDDLRITANFLTDTIPPFITQIRSLSGRIINIVFSEDVEPKSIVRENMLLSPGDLQPDSFKLSGNELKIFFKEDFKQRKKYFIRINGIEDLEGNIAGELSAELIYYEAEIYDLIITEIMADPQPQVYLPDKEYVEIFNRSDYTVELDSFVLITGTRKWIFPDYSLKSNEYLVITGQGGQDAFPGVNSLDLFTSTSIITNDGQQLSIIDNKGRIISAVEFGKDWYGNNSKSEGGWSLERIDNSNVCGETSNWRASNNPSGGTPGKVNSVIALNPDNERPEINRIIFQNENKLEFSFTESMNPYTLADPIIFKVIGYSIIPDSIKPEIPFSKSVVLTYPETFKKGTIYEFGLSESIADCSGNKLFIKYPVRFGIPVVCRFLDVLISEILFAPTAGCPEFIELYNNSDSLLELSDMRILVTENGNETAKVISQKQVLFFPGEYLAITKDKNALMAFFDIKNQENIIECADLPAFPNEGACIKILNRSLVTVDEYCYSPEDQFVLFSDPNGVSLERIQFDKVTGNQSLWHSSSSIAGFGTPGYENSQKLDEKQTNADFEIQPEIFTPDNDGKDDIMIFSYLFEKEGYIGTACIFDPSGRIVKYLGCNLLLGTKGYFSWDGRDESGRLCRLGIYLVFMEAYHPSGKVRKYKGTVVLAKYRL